MIRAIIPAAIAILTSCSNRPYIRASEADRQATRESAYEIMSHLPGWTVADSSWWSHQERLKGASIEEVHLHLVAVKGRDTLYIETGEMYGNEYMSGLVRYPHTFDTPLNEKRHKNIMTESTLGKDSCFSLSIDPDSVMSASFLKRR